MTDKEYEQFKNFVYKLQYEIMTIDDYEIILNSVGIPIVNKNRDDYYLCKTGCHNIDCSCAKANLVFYLETKSFYCWSECQKSYSIYSLLQKRFKLLGEEKTFYQTVKYICNRLGIEFNFKEEVKRDKSIIYNWKADVLKYLPHEKEQQELKIYDKNILNYFPKIYHQSWIDDHISVETMDKYGIRYYPYHDSIVIPCIDKDGNMIGIRERFLNPNSEVKYLPLSMCNGDSYKFPINQTLYGLNYNSDNIRHYKKVVIGEAEKFTLQCETYFGCKNFSVSLYGKSMSKEKLKQLLELGIEEVIIGLDFDYKEVGDNEEFENFKRNVYRIGDYFKGYCKVTAMISYEGHDLKDSPTDKGKERYIELFNNREELY